LPSPQSGTISFFTAVAFLALTVAALLVLRRRAPAPAAYRTPGYPVTPLLFLVPIGCLLALLLLNDPVRALLGVAVMALGIPVYLLLRRRRGAGTTTPSTEKGDVP
jgi:APA family basic amino acid/polyamine antiporter